MSQFAKGNNVYFEFYPKHFLVKDILTKETILQGKKFRGLYKFNVANSRNPEFRRKWHTISGIEQEDKCKNFDIRHSKLGWHSKLGHSNVSIVKKVLNNNNISFQKNSVPYICTYCQMCKSHKFAFPVSETNYTKPLELIASDLWGPAPINTDYGYKYYVSFVDAYSRYVWIYFLGSKYETHNVVLQFIAQAEKQINCQLKVMQTDGGSEFQPLKEYFQRKGIIHRITFLYTSEQYGLVEEKHRHIVETRLTLLA